jgi:hypothetical protein
MKIRDSRIEVTTSRVDMLKSGTALAINLPHNTRN